MARPIIVVVLIVVAIALVLANKLRRIDKDTLQVLANVAAIAAFLAAVAVFLVPDGNPPGAAGVPLAPSLVGPVREVTATMHTTAPLVPIRRSETPALSVTPTEASTATATHTPMATAVPTAAPTRTAVVARTPVRTPTDTAIPFVGLQSGTMLLSAGQSVDRQEIFLLQAGDPKWRQITADGHQNANPAWSPTHDRIAYDSYQDSNRWVIVSSRDGSNANRVRGGFHPSWSPDGSMLVYDRVGLYVLDLATGEESWNIVPGLTSRGWVGNAAWSPAGDWIAFNAYSQWDRTAIYLVKRDGSQLRTAIASDRWNAGCPAWSPDGKQIAFLSDMSGRWGIYTVPADGSDPVCLADLPANPTQGGCPCWSPDAAQIVFVADIEQDGFPDVYAIRLSDSSIVRLTDNLQYPLLSAASLGR